VEGIVTSNAAAPAAAGPPRNSIADMRDSVLFDGVQRRNRLTRFWILLVLASVIASAGVLADSTATVIGAMIVAPMMLPIQGTMLSVVLADRTNLLRSIALMVTGALAAIGVGFFVGLLAVYPVVAATNSQVAGRVSPGLVDLLAALATGAVGSIALIRKDISDTLPGVAIAISLVPPLCVAGLTLESGAFSESLGAALLFLTNVAAILLTGVVVMALMRVHQLAVAESAVPEGVNRRKAVAVIVAMALIVGVPLAGNTIALATSRVREAKVSAAAQSWTLPTTWRVIAVNTKQGRVIVSTEGSGTQPSVDQLRSALRSAGVNPSEVTVIFVPTISVDLAEQPR
jgi:uncharacterized hydrophobic protein (TIGR00271 family)